MTKLYTNPSGPRSLHLFNSVDALDAYCVLERAGPAVLGVSPGTGTVTVSVAIDTLEAIEAGTATWYPAEGLGAGGVVSAALAESLPHGIAAVRFVASTADASARVSQ